MTNEEIVRDYNAAKNKQKQVRILADLNQTSPSEILTVLAEEGVEGVKRPEKIMPRKKPKAAANAPEPVQPFWQRMEAILDALPEKLPPEAAGIVQNLLQTLFADYLGQRLEGRARDDA